MCTLSGWLEIRPCLKEFSTNVECRAWEPETLKQRDRQKWSAQKNLLCLASEVYNNSVPDSVPSAVAQDCCCRGRYSGYTGKHIKSFAVHRFLYSVESTVKSFQAVQIKMRLQLNLKILQLRFLNDQLIFISADFQIVNFIHHSVKSGIKTENSRINCVSCSFEFNLPFRIFSMVAIASLNGEK